MDDQVRDLLLSNDHPTACESPPGFDWKASMATVRELLPHLEAIVGQPLKLDDQVQDASFFADIACYREANHPGLGRVFVPIVAVRFSAFASLFTVTRAEDFAAERFERVVAAVADAGFVYVPADELDEPYTGENPHLAKTTWWTRYFDYL